MSQNLKQILKDKLNPHEIVIYQKLLNITAKKLKHWKQGAVLGDKPYACVLYLKELAEQEFAKITEMKNLHEQFHKRYSYAQSGEQQENCILDYAKELGSGFWKLKQDRRAFRRYFDFDAIVDRYLRFLRSREKKLVFLIKSLTIVYCDIVSTIENIEELWQVLQLEKHFAMFLKYKENKHIRIIAFKNFSKVLQVLPENLRQTSISEETLQSIFKACLETSEEVWIQCEAIELLQFLSQDSLETVLGERLRKISPGDDLFVRRAAVNVLGRNISNTPSLELLMTTILDDPSPFVRQEVARIQVYSTQAMDGLKHLSLEDKSPEVRAQAILSLFELLSQKNWQREIQELLLEISNREKNTFVLRVLLHVIQKIATNFYDKENKESWKTFVDDILLSLNDHNNSIIRGICAQTNQYSWVLNCPETAKLLDKLQTRLSKCKSGTTIRFSKKLFRNYKRDDVGRLLTIFTQNDFGLDINWTWRGVYITKGHIFRFRLWRFLYEFFHPAPDKRQGFQHVIGRKFYGNMRIPSRVLCELSETKVPGEPLFIAEEESWRPYLPLVDDMISCLNYGIFSRRYSFYTSEGITEICSPPFWKRLFAYLSLSFKFARYADYRNWKKNSQQAPSLYIASLRKLGFQISFREYSDNSGEASNPSIATQFFSLGLLGVFWSEEQFKILGRDFREYFISINQNSFFHLFLFTATMFLLFFGLHWYKNFRIRKARKNIPLVIGGWGTRGKSGTERLKAALISALGYSVVSKTTGCEAMFLYGYPFDSVHEIFLFRPYDKATIWEQYNLVLLAEKLDAEIFLWECMALNPSYVDILQKCWMKDDISTITNTYPDHEDIQGPAGIDVAKVISLFTPTKSKLITSEEQMLPLLSEAAHYKKTKFSSIGWLEAGLIPSDILERFPYNEHPYNIALVLEIAKELGVEKDFALKEMADQVIADIGVLKTYPIATLNTRRLQYTNGMSANERLGCLSNWERLGLYKENSLDSPGKWITTVINNRADRIPRSKVFAKIIAEDIDVDRHFLIGNNLKGMMGYIQEAWELYTQKLILPENAKERINLLETMAKRLHIPHNEKHLSDYLNGMLPEKLSEKKLDHFFKNPELLEVIPNSEVIKEFMNDAKLKYQKYSELKKNLASDESLGKLQKQFQEQLWLWFKSKIIVIEDYYASGEMVIEKICEKTPPGFYNHIIGLQNIKGTGLDFVYTWQAWGNCYDLCLSMKKEGRARVEEATLALTLFRNFNILSKEFTENTIKECQGAPLYQNQKMQKNLEYIALQLQTKTQENSSQFKKNNGFKQLIRSIFKNFFDAGDAIVRRQQANRIYSDLAKSRISISRAIKELQKINKRQKET